MAARSPIGVDGGQADPLPMVTLFDKQVEVRMGQANVKRWIDDVLSWVLDDADRWAPGPRPFPRSSEVRVAPATRLGHTPIT